MSQAHSGGKTSAPGWGASYRLIVLLLVVLWGLVVVALFEPVASWLASDERYDRDTLVEWLEETRSPDTLPEMVEGYLKALRELEALPAPAPPNPPENDALAAVERAHWRVGIKQEEIYEQLQTLANPPTKIFPGQLPLFPVIYRLEVRFDEPRYPSIVWDSEIPYRPYPQEGKVQPAGQYRLLEHPLAPGARVFMIYQVHAFKKQQRTLVERQRRLTQVVVLVGVATGLAVLWLVLLQRRDREREHQRQLAQLQAEEARRQHEDTERKLLEQRLAAQAAEQRVLELRSQMYASIGIMACSYAHNIKNLLVRPNDLLERCLEDNGLSDNQTRTLTEVRQTLGQVTERLQQILRTVRSDPNRAERSRIDLNAMLRQTEATWKELARDRWKLDLVLDLAPGELALEGDASHLQQMIENLLFNARDAIFEMRGQLREQAHRDPGLDRAARQRAVLAAASWRGRVTLRTQSRAGEIVLEVIDNGAGMTEEVHRRCTEAHFSTKRDNALHEGNNTGMGLGLAFVTTILEHHHAHLEIESEPLRGAIFRLRFPADASK